MYHLQLSTVVREWRSQLEGRALSCSYITVMATRNPARIFIDSSDTSESEPTLTSGDSDDPTSESESEEDNPDSSKVTEPPRNAGRAKRAAIS